MLDFVFQHWYLLTLLAALASLLAAVYVAQRPGARSYSVFAAAFLLLAALGALPFVVVSPERQVRAVLADLLDAGREKDAARIVRRLDPAIQADGLSRDQIEEMLRRQFERVEIDSLVFNNVEVEASRDEATAGFVAVVSGSAHGQPFANYPMRFLLAFEKRDGEWYVAAAERRSIVGNEAEPLRF